MRPQLFDCDKLEFSIEVHRKTDTLFIFRKLNITSQLEFNNKVKNVYDTFFTLVLLHMRNYFLHARVNRAFRTGKRKD